MSYHKEVKNQLYQKEVKPYASPRVRFEDIAVSFGVTDFRIDSKGRYKNKDTEKAYSIYRIGRADSRRNTGCNYVIGRIVNDKKGKTYEFSQRPRIHTSPTQAREEQDRLCEQYPNEIFVLFASQRARSVKFVEDEPRRQNVSDTPKVTDENVIRAKHYFADDGFGELIKNEYQTRLNIYFYIENDINI